MDAIDGKWKNTALLVIDMQVISVSLSSFSSFFFFFDFFCYISSIAFWKFTAMILIELLWYFFRRISYYQVVLCMLKVEKL